MPTETVKFRLNGYKFPVQMTVENGRWFFEFGFNRLLLNEIKAMKGRHWHGYDSINPRKVWSAEICPHNQFQLDYLLGLNPYAPYETELQPIPLVPRFNKSKGKELPPLKHQPTMTAHIVQRKRCIVAGEMGTTKTYCCMTALEILGGRFLESHGYAPDIWYVAPRSALRAVQREFMIWGSALDVQFMTYEENTKRMKNWEPGAKAPAFIVFDESSKLKTHTAQRTQAAQALADGARRDWGEDAVVVLMTGTPAPKSPADWWSQAEIACPGFLKEGTIHQFNERLGIIVKRENFEGGGVYPHLVTWRDNENKCNKCGRFQDDNIHDPMVGVLAAGKDPESAHAFEPSKNEVEYLHRRLKGLVYVILKKDCLDLPEKTYRPIEIKPKPETLRAAKLITKAAKTVIEGLTRLRELSDGFQYVDIKQGKQPCSRCDGKLTATEYEEIPGSCPNCKGYAEDFQCPQHLPERKEVLIPCPNCGQTGEEDKIVRSVQEVTSPKEQVLIDLLDEYEDVGRVVIYAGFTAAIDRVVRICQKQKWVVIRIDQGKEQIFDEQGKILGISDYVTLFQDRQLEYPRVVFVAHPKSGGMGLTLTASPVIIYWSNDFDGEARSQSEDRIHRPGMDVNLGATIIDLFHLPSDRKVYDNLKLKRNLELMSLGELSEALKGDGHARVT